MRTTRIIGCLAVTGLLPLAAPADDAAMPDLTALSLACESALALSALPARLRSDATVYALQDGHYEKLRGGDGAFTCAVERRHRASVMPQCMDRAGADTILPALLERSERVVEGAAPDARGDHAHALEAPARPGVSYMMSDFNFAWIPSAGLVRKVAPHVMFYAPGLTNDDIGGSLRSGTENHGTPFIIDPGPHGFMITYTEHASESDDVARACGAELPSAPPPFEPFPRGDD